MKALTFLLALLGLATASAPRARAQLVFLKGTAEGTGVTRAIGSDCFAVTAGHVVKDSGAVVAVDARRIPHPAQVIFTDAGEDLAVVAIQGSGAMDACASGRWPDPTRVEAVLKGSLAQGVLTRLEQDGSRTPLAVTINRIDEFRFLRATPADPNRPIVATWSGSVLAVGDDIVALAITTDPAGASAKLYRFDYIDSRLDRFFRERRPLRSRIVQAVIKDDLSEVQGLLASPGVTQVIRDDALLNARSGQMAEALIKLGANPATHTIGTTPLCAAVARRSTEVVQVLVRQPGIQPNELCVDPLYTLTPVGIVVDKWRHEEWPDVLEALSHAPGIDPNVKDRLSGKPAIIQALTSNEAPELAEALMRMPNINLNLIDSLGRTAADVACEYGQQGLLQELVRRGARGHKRSAKELRRCIETGKPY